MDNRKLDALIAEKVLGLKVSCKEIKLDETVVWTKLPNCEPIKEPPEMIKIYTYITGKYSEESYEMVPDYSSNIEDAWDALKGLLCLGWSLSIRQMDRPSASGPEWEATYGESPDIREKNSVIGRSAPEAFCLLLLKLENIEFDSGPRPVGNIP